MVKNGVKMDKQIEKFLIMARLRDIDSDISGINTTLEIAEFAEYQQDWLDKEKIKLEKLVKEQKTLKESL